MMDHLVYVVHQLLLVMFVIMFVRVVAAVVSPQEQKFLLGVRRRVLTLRMLRWGIG